MTYYQNLPNNFYEMRAWGLSEHDTQYALGYHVLLAIHIYVRNYLQKWRHILPGSCFRLVNARRTRCEACRPSSQARPQLGLIAIAMAPATHFIIFAFDEPRRFGQVDSAFACTESLDWQPAFIYDCHAAVTKTDQRTTVILGSGHICKIPQKLALGGDLCSLAYDFGVGGPRLCLC
jgi:hypothetical protein